MIAVLDKHLKKSWLRLRRLFDNYSVCGANPGVNEKCHYFKSSKYIQMFLLPCHVYLLY